MQHATENNRVKKQTRRHQWLFAIAGLLGLLAVWHFILRPSLKPFDADSDTSLLEFTWTGPVNRQVGGFRETSDGVVPGISNVTRKAASGYSLYSARLLEKGWVFWWDSKGNPQLIVRTEGTTSEYPISNRNEMYVIVPRFGLPLEVAIFNSSGLRFHQERVISFIQRVNARNLSDDQVGQILEMLDELGAVDDPVVLAFLKSVALGKRTLSHCQERGGDDPGFFEEKIEGSAAFLLPLRLGAVDILARSAGAGDEATASLLDNPATAIRAYRALEARSQLPTDIAVRLGKAASQASPEQTLEIVAKLKNHDAPAAANLCVQLMLNGNRRIRERAFDEQLKAFVKGGRSPESRDDLQLFRYADKAQIMSAFATITDPRTKQEWRNTIVRAVEIPQSDGR